MLCTVSEHGKPVSRLSRKQRHIINGCKTRARFDIAERIRERLRCPCPVIRLYRLREKDLEHDFQIDENGVVSCSVHNRPDMQAIHNLPLNSDVVMLLN